MSQKIVIPAPFRTLANGAGVLKVEASDVRRAILEADRQCPGLKQRLLGDGDQLNRFVNVFVDGEDVRFLDSLDTPLEEGSEIDILLAIAGG